MDQRLQDETDRVRDKFPAWTDAEVTRYAVKLLAYEDALAKGDACVTCGTPHVDSRRACECDVDAPPTALEEALAPYRVEYVTARGECWASNALTFATVEDAEREARDRSFRWTAVRLARVVPVSTPDRQPCDYEDPGPVVVDYR